jgi:VWFA-related protein
VSFRDKTSIGTAIEYAQRADTIIYSILFAAPIRPYRPFRAAAGAISAEHGKKVMQRLAHETGGAYFEVSKDNPIKKIYATIEDALRNQYSIGYRPEQPGKTGDYRTIKLITKQPGLIVQTRDGYYVK